ncbi:MAG: DUF4981 domain-containing protein [Spirochaetia bacterium]|nr:DUF4981 domain-containing protein [Spirochaetia bacterium]
MNYTQSTDPTIFEENRLPGHSLFSAHKGVKETSLNGSWYFSYASHPKEATSQFLEIEQVEQMETIPVPSHFSLQGYGSPQYTNTMYPWDGLSQIRPPQIPEDNPTGCYAKIIDISLQQLQQDIIIRFDGVDSAMYLYVNGAYVGYKEDSFSPGEFLITPYLVEGKNLISVMNLRYSTGSWLEDQDFWRLPGIFRSVTLLECEKKRITDVFIRPTLVDDFSVGEVDIEITTSCDISYTTHLSINEKEYSTNHFTIFHPLLWSAEEPNLYYYTLEIRDNGTIIDSVSGHFGFRKIEIKGRTVLLNGKRLILRGVNRHEFDPFKARVIDKELIKKDILLMKQNNINALRTSHYPNHPYVYELCDTLGIYMMDEINLETHGTWMIAGKGERKWYTVPDDKQEWKEAVLDRARSMTMRDKNYPSIIFYSCGNESFGGSVINEVATYFRSLNDNKLVHYEGIYYDRRYNNSSDIESRMYAKVEELKEYLAYGDKPLLLCEYAHAMGNSVGNLNEYVELEDVGEAYCGGFIWDFVDQSLIIEGEERAGLGFSYPTDGYFCINGIVDGRRNPSAKLEQVKYSYRPVDITIRNNEIIINNKNLFTSSDQYDFTFEYAIDGHAIETGTLLLDISPLETKKIPLPPLETSQIGEYTLVVSVLLKHDTSWALKGHIIVTTGKVVKCIKKNTSTIAPAPLIKGDMHTGYRNKDYSFLVHHHLGHIVAIQHKMINILTSPIKLEFWRAPTDNDLGVNPILSYSSCKLASLYQVATQFKIEENIIYTTIQCGPYSIPLSYCFIENKAIITIDPPPFDSFIPCFGLSFSVTKSFKNISYYGNEMKESYQDRRGGNVLRRVSFDPYKDQRSYLHPQEYGNRIDVRELSLSDNEGKQMNIRANRPFECSVIPYSSHELENATYRDDLPTTTSLHVRILEGQSGVGGDDSWGAPVHEEYRYRGPKEKWIVEIALEELPI